MANVLNTDKQIAVIGALAEGSSIRSIERITGVHRDTIMRPGESRAWLRIHVGRKDARSPMPLFAVRFKATQYGKES